MPESTRSHSSAVDALERLYVNVRADYPFSVRDMLIVKDELARLKGIEEQVEAAMDDASESRDLWLESEARAKTLYEQFEAALVLLRQGQRLHDNRSHAEWAERAEAFARGTPGGVKAECGCGDCSCRGEGR